MLQAKDKGREAPPVEVEASTMAASHTPTVVGWTNTTDGTNHVSDFGKSLIPIASTGPDREIEVLTGNEFSNLLYRAFGCTARVSPGMVVAPNNISIMQGLDASMITAAQVHNESSSSSPHATCTTSYI
jgi:hypothetical protein